MTPAEREAIIQSAIGSLALSDITITREQAEEAMRRVETMPLPRIGEDA